MLNCRVLDLSDHRGQMAGALLADLGADVILVEPPGGSAARDVTPFVAGREGDPEASLWFWSYNRGKRSVVLDLDDARDRQRLRDLAATADVLIESDAPGAMAARGLGAEDLAEVNPGLVYTSISAFGQTGPKADWAATDSVISAAGQLSNVVGDEDRPPLRIPLDQCFLHASAEAAVGSLIALRERKRSGQGQHIDVSAQQAVTQATQSATLCHLYNSPELLRMSGGARLGPFRVRLRSPAADGYVSVTILFGESIGPFGARLFEWMHSEGGCADGDLEVDWIHFVEGVITGRIPLTEYERIQQVAADFTATRTKAELLEVALDKRLLIVPIATVADVVESPQYSERDFWRDIPTGGLDSVRYPGPLAKFSETPLDISTPPPSIGEHTGEVLAEVGAAAPVPVSDAVVAAAGSSHRDPSLPLADVKILDFMWVMAGPGSTRVLADWGATVVRVESSHKVEAARTIQPFLNDEAGADNGGLYQNMNAGKLGITIDISKPESRDLILDLVRWADVVCESFSPHALQDIGLSYEDLRAVKPDIIMASSCLFGQSGPLSSLAGFGTMGAAMSGFYEMTGWPDRDPAGVFGAYTDYVSPKFLSAALLAALDHRDRTGEGQYIDLSQAEASMTFLAPAVLDYEVNGHLPDKLGNDHPVMSPHGVFASAGEDRWIAVACANDDQWRALCEVIGADGFAGLGVDERRERADEIAELITAWTSVRDGLEAHDELQAAGIAAHAIADSAIMATDPQLEHRNHFRNVPHGTNGTMWVEGTRFMMSRSSDGISHGGPTYGEHTFEVLEQLLGYDQDRIAELAVAGVLE
ncbi:CaiB/BaiF CoA transferase family protein [Candidatus Poriferisodalis sp.]|uniref:CaiB/BaiF CoA transferase family protein n=1 Tax=Candidatus Poriferisodalis sp. TaxID=3101277 RepID=UPI003B529B6B